MRVYITGLINNEFKEKLSSLREEISKIDVNDPITVLSPLDSDVYFELNDNLFMKDRAIQMIKCELVITLDNWFECKSAKKEIEIARLLKMPVFHHSKALEVICQQ